MSSLKGRLAVVPAELSSTKRLDEITFDGAKTPPFGAPSIKFSRITTAQPSKASRTCIHAGSADPKQKRGHDRRLQSLSQVSALQSWRPSGHSSVFG